MTLTRWKLLAGILGTSIVGLVAMANPQCPGKNATTREKTPQPRETVTAVATVHKAQDPVISIPAIAPVANLPIDTQNKLALPEIENQVVTLPAPTPAESTTPPSIPLPETKLPELPITGIQLQDVKQDFAAIPPALPKPAPPEIKSPLPTPAAEVPKIEPLLPTLIPTETKAMTTPDLAGSSVPRTPNVKIDPTPSRSATAAIPPTHTLETHPSELKPAPFPTIETVRETTIVKREQETRVRVIVPLGKGEAKFEIIKGDTILLQAVCEKVEVRSPDEKTGSVSPIKASGKVRFVAPGCEGTCENLAVLPASGEVELNGSVRVQCQYGQTETLIQSNTMKFKLGSTQSPASESIRPSNYSR